LATAGIQTLAERLGTFAVEFDLKRDPARAALLEKAKVHILDGIGVALGSSTMEDGYARKLLQMVRGYGSVPTCTIIGFPDRAAPALAAVLNGSLIHGCEFDDIYRGWTIHAESFSVPTSLALAEQRELDGWNVLEGFLVTAEVALRTAHGCNQEGINHLGFHTTSIFGTVGAAAGAARLLGLDANRVADAISLSVSLTSGTNEGWNDLSGRNKSIQPGWAAMGGIMAAQMAAAGYECSHSTLDGPRGLLASHAWKHGWSAEPVVDGLGSDWKCLRLAFKVYPAGGRSQTVLDCTRELVFEHDIKPEEVQRVEVTIPSQWAYEFERASYPKRYRPDSGYAMHGSWPCNVARMILSRELGLQHLTQEGITEPSFLALADKVTCRPGDDSQYPREERPTTVVIHTPRGSFERTRQKSTGEPDTFDPERIVDKFRRNARLVLPEKNVDELVDLVMDLEQLTDIRSVTRLLSV
jgi:2-methylcitrate dehydratase PrpD